MTQLLGLVLSVMALVAAGYTLRSMCIARKMHRDPRPFAATVFSLVAFSIMEVSWSLSSQINQVDDYFNAAWRMIDTILLGCIWWLVIVASRKRKERR